MDGAQNPSSFILRDLLLMKWDQLKRILKAYRHCSFSLVQEYYYHKVTILASTIVASYPKSRTSKTIKNATIFFPQPKSPIYISLYWVLKEMTLHIHNLCFYKLLQIYLCYITNPSNMLYAIKMNKIVLNLTQSLYVYFFNPSSFFSPLSHLLTFPRIT